MHSLRDLHTRTKTDPNEINLQQGSGDSQIEKEESNEEPQPHVLKDILKQSQPLVNNDDPIEFNDRKRKQMGEEIHESFLHPSFVKTSKISVPRPNKKNSTLDSKKEMKNEKTKSLKHKFKFA